MRPAIETVLGAALEMQQYLSHAGERFCFIGAIALQRWGEPRLTRDVDVTVLTPDVVLRTCSAEDLVVLKAFASRPQDWLDVDSVAIRLHSGLDWKLVFEELEPLAAVREQPGLLERLRELQGKAG